MFVICADITALFSNVQNRHSTHAKNVLFIGIYPIDYRPLVVWSISLSTFSCVLWMEIFCQTPSSGQNKQRSKVSVYMWAWPTAVCTPHKKLSVW